MLATSDGEFYPEKELDKSYKIPKNRGGSIKSDPSGMAYKGGKAAFGNQNPTPLADSYYNYPYDPSAAGAYYQNHQQPFNYGNQSASAPSGNFQQKVINAFQQNREKPKNYNKNIYGNAQGNNNQGAPPGQGFGNQNQNNWGNKARNFQPKPRFQNQNNEGFNKHPNQFGKFNNQNQNKGGFNKFSNHNQSEGGFNKFSNQQEGGFNRFNNQNQGYKGFNKFNNQNNGGFNKFNNQQQDYGNFNRQGGGFNHRQGFKRGFQSNTDENSDNYFSGNNFNTNRFFNNDSRPKFPKKKPPPVDIPVHEIVPDLQDASLPKDLKLLFQPLFCKLCSAQLSSNQTAKMHYKSKNHEKKIKKWLVEYSEKSGEPLHPRAQATVEKKAEEGEQDPKWFHCEVCDLQLTGKLHAESHYMGRNHQRAVLGHKAPAGQGYYDSEGKWVRVKSAKSKSMNFEGGEDNFGAVFKRTPEEEAAGPPAKKKKESQPAQQYHCDVCDINTTCDEQLQNHYKGQKHAKKLKLLGATAATDPTKVIVISDVTIEPPQTQIEAVPLAVPTVADVNGDLSVYRTPSGNYYCPTCNLTTNSEQQFRQHLTSKNHAKKASQANVTEKPAQ